MTDSVFFGGSLVAATVAGMIALLAPCCISVMLPAYFASSFQNRRRLVAMTFLFRAGIATVILPIALGASALLQLINGGHTPLYIAGGLFMVALGLYTLAGGRIDLRSLGRGAGGGTGPAAVYSLGLFSGLASSCCARRQADPGGADAGVPAPARDPGYRHARRSGAGDARRAAFPAGDPD